MPQGKPVSVPDDGLTTRQRRRQPILAVHTGTGKGKSTAAFGMALRAWNAGWPIAVFQFVKSPKWKVGEEAALRALGTTGGAPITWHKMGDGWSWLARPGTERDHAAEAVEGWAQIKRDLAAEAYPFYVLDEFTYPMRPGRHGGRLQGRARLHRPRLPRARRWPAGPQPRPGAGRRGPRGPALRARRPGRFAGCHRGRHGLVRRPHRGRRLRLDRPRRAAARRAGRARRRRGRPGPVGGRARARLPLVPARRAAGRGQSQPGRLAPARGDPARRAGGGGYAGPRCSAPVRRGRGAGPPPRARPGRRARAGRSFDGRVAGCAHRRRRRPVHCGGRRPLGPVAVGAVDSSGAGCFGAAGHRGRRRPGVQLLICRDGRTPHGGRGRRVHCGPIARRATARRLPRPGRGWRFSRGVRGRAGRQRATQGGRFRAGPVRPPDRRRMRRAALAEPVARRRADVRGDRRDGRDDTFADARLPGRRRRLAELADPGRRAGDRARVPPDHCARRPAYTGVAITRSCPDGFVAGGVHASYLHLHWAGHPEMASRLVDAAASAAATTSPT